jgi:RNA polymerase sigma factor (sigma-70 family)
MYPNEYGKPQSEQLLDMVALAVDNLDERSRECIEAIHFERRSYSQLAERLGCSKPHAWRLTRRAEEELREVLSQIQPVKEKYG